MKTVEIKISPSVVYEVRDVPEHVEMDNLEHLLSSKKMSKLEELGLNSCDYARLIESETFIIPAPSDYAEAIRRIYSGVRYHVKEFISFETGESLEHVELWLQGKYSFSKESLRKIRDFIRRGLP